MSDMNANYWAEEADRLYIKCIKALTDLETLKAENKRLHKAGDAMYELAVQDSMGLWVMPAFEAWSVIKKERNSK